MFLRHSYKPVPETGLPTSEGYVATLKYDGGSYFIPVAKDGTLSFISRRPSVKGGFPDKTDRVPHLSSKKLPEFAGSVFNVELVHSGHAKNSVESHRQVSGILNSLPERAVATQQALGPVRAVLHNVINPSFGTFQQKLDHMKAFEAAFGNPEVMFVPELHHGPAIHQLKEKTLREGREGIVVTHLTKPESENPRLKVVHKLLHNLRVTRVLQEFDKDGIAKPSMGALELADATGGIVGQVGTGFSRRDRIDAWENPENWIGETVQIESRGIAANRLRMPVYNGFGDGEVDRLL